MKSSQPTSCSRYERLRAWFIDSDGYLWDWLAAAALIIIDHLVPIVAIAPVQVWHTVCASQLHSLCSHCAASPQSTASRNVTQRLYSLTDEALAYPYRSNTVSSTVLYILVFAFPGIVFIAGAMIQRSAADG